MAKYFLLVIQVLVVFATKLNDELFKQYQSENLLEESLLQTQILNLDLTSQSTNGVKPKRLAQTKTKSKTNSMSASQSLVKSESYNSMDIMKILDNLEFLTHKPTSVATQEILKPNQQKTLRLHKMQNLVDLANQNLENSTQLSMDGLIQNPKLVSFKLMKLDLEQSCRQMCEIEKKAPKAQQKVQVIQNSTEQLQVQELQHQKSNITSTEEQNLAQNQERPIFKNKLSQLFSPEELNFMQLDSDLEIQEKFDQYIKENYPSDELNLQQKEQMKFDFLEKFKSFGNKIMSLFQSDKSSEEKQQEQQRISNDIDEDNIQIEIVNNTTPKKVEDQQTNKASIKRQHKMTEKELNNPDYQKARKELIAKLVKPMGNPAELDQTLKEQTLNMNKVSKGDIIEDISTNSFVSIDEKNMQDMSENKTQPKQNVQKNTTKLVHKQSAAVTSTIQSTPIQFYYQVKDTCPFQKCGLQELQGKKWASVEDAGILLCTKSPDKVDCLKYNTEYQKLLKLQEDLQSEGVIVDF